LQETIQKFKKNPQVIGFHINSNAGSSAEQSVFHTHIHLVPLYEENQNEWDSFSTKNFTSKGANQFSINNELRIIKNHINDCISQNILEKKDEGVVESFNLSAYTNGDN
jgi:diadenosine tetraphosphate (Ap4A) HIT family hydrolase